MVFSLLMYKKRKGANFPSYVSILQTFGGVSKETNSKVFPFIWSFNIVVWGLSNLITLFSARKEIDFCPVFPSFVKKRVIEFP